MKSKFSPFFLILAIFLQLYFLLLVHMWNGQILVLFYYLFVASDAKHISGWTSPKTSSSEAAKGWKKQVDRRLCYPASKIPLNSGGSSSDRYSRCHGGAARWSKKPSKIVAELTEMKAREKAPSLLVLSESVLTFINHDDDDVVVETPPKAPPAAIMSPIIVPEPHVHQPLCATLSLPSYTPPQMRSPLSTIDRNSQIFCSIPSLGPSDQQK